MKSFSGISIVYHNYINIRLMESQRKSRHGVKRI